MFESIQDHMAWRAVPIAGLVGGAIFLIMNMLVSSVAYGSEPLYILYYFGSLVMGEQALADPTMTLAIVGLVVHIILSILFAFVIAVVIHRWGLIVGIIGGAILGLTIYGINFYNLVYFVQGPFSVSINNMWLMLSHVIFGAVVGGVYESLDNYDTEFVLEGQKS